MSESIWSLVLIIAAIIAMIAAHRAHLACVKAASAHSLAMEACSLEIDKLSASLASRRAETLISSQLLAASIRQFEELERSPKACEVSASLTPSTPSDSKCFKNNSDLLVDTQYLKKWTENASPDKLPEVWDVVETTTNTTEAVLEGQFGGSRAIAPEGAKKCQKT